MANEKNITIPVIPTDEEKATMLSEQILTALDDYFAHTYREGELGGLNRDNFREFAKKLAHDSVVFKGKLRSLLRKHPNWVEELDAVVLSAESTANPKYSNIREAIDSLLVYLRSEADSVTDENFLKLLEVGDFLRQAFARWASTDTSIEDCHLWGEHWDEAGFVKYLDEHFPKAYAKGKKASKVLRAILTQLGVWEEKAGKFQRLYSTISDELSTRKIQFPFIISINPAHQLTMSNPNGDSRGECLVSCHSLTSDYEACRAGAIGYARDDCSIITFVPADINNPETLNNRKIMRQMFFYKDGTLMQSRLYDTQGGRRSFDEEDKSLFALYRHLVEKAISACENLPNMWETPLSHDNLIDKLKEAGDTDFFINTHRDFQGYPDWLHGFPNRITKIKNHNKFVKFTVGNGGRCMKCGCETSVRDYDHLLCSDCSDTAECDECGCEYSDDDLMLAYDRYGDEVRICQDCADNYYYRCVECGELHRSGGDEVYVESVDGLVCEECLDDYYSQCECCGEYYRNDDLTDTADGSICESCLYDNYTKCDECGEYYHNDEMHNTGNGCDVCNNCLDSCYTQCDDCGEYYPNDDIETGDDGNQYCFNCIENHRTEENEENTETEAV